MKNWKWTADKVLPVWDAHDEANDVSLVVRRHGRHRFSWDVTCDFQIEAGVDEISGSALSLKAAKAMAEAAAKRLESSPIDWSMP